MISTLCGSHGEVRKEFAGSFMGYFTGRAAFAGQSISSRVEPDEGNRQGIDQSWAGADQGHPIEWVPSTFNRWPQLLADLLHQCGRSEPG